MRKKTEPLKGVLIAIDGPAGAGKSTVSKKLAETLGGMLLDTGGMYRAVAYFAIQYRIQSEEGLEKLARDLAFSIDPKERVLLIDGEHLGAKIRTPEVSNRASQISALKRVRTVLTREQRRIGKRLSRLFPVVVEGRDIGTVVFPSALFKFFVTAEERVRARRRLAQLKKTGARGLELREILKSNSQRDRQDSQRKLAPLRCAEDAVVVDTSSMRVGQVVRFMSDHIHGRMAALKKVHKPRS